MIKLIASDMDGTLLNDKMEVSDENAQAIRDAQAAGIEFMVATGRGVTEATPLLAAQDLKPAFITLNGAMVLKSSPTKASFRTAASNVFKMLPIYWLISTQIQPTNWRLRSQLHGWKS